MKDIDLKTILGDLFEDWAKEQMTSFEPINSAGSNRKYFRIAGKNKRAIGAFNEDIKENLAFIQFSKSFQQADLQVPEVFSCGNGNSTYLLEDLGDQSLFDLRTAEPINCVSETTLDYYKNALSELLKFQFICSQQRLF